MPFICQKHITYDEIETYEKINEDFITSDGVSFYKNFEARVDNCTVCDRRFRAYITLSEMTNTDLNKENPIKAGIQKVKKWLSDLGFSIVEAVETALTPLAQPMGTYGALVRATKGKAIKMEEVSASDIGINFVKVSPGYYEFNLDDETSFCLEISSELAGKVDCVAVVGLSEATILIQNTFKLYLLKGRRLTKDILLPAGEYGLYLINNTGEGK